MCQFRICLGVWRDRGDGSFADKAAGVAEAVWLTEAQRCMVVISEIGGPDYASCPHPWTQPRPPLVAPSFGGWHMPAKALRMMDLAILDRCLVSGVSPILVSTDTAARKQIAAAYFADLNQSIARKPWTVGTVQAFTWGDDLV